MTTEQAELTARVAEMRETIADLESDGSTATVQRNMLSAYEKALAELGGPVAPRTHALTARPKAGAPASNQYGTFRVSYATEKQTAFIKALMDRKDLSGADLDVAALREQVANVQVNKKAASAIIDTLLAQPDAVREDVRQRPGTPATDRQKEFVRTLLAEREGNETAEAVRAALNAARLANELTAATVSAAITTLLEIKAEAKNEVPEAGVYVLPSSQLVRVYLGQNSGQMLAKVVVGGELEYVGKAEKVLVPGSRKATVEEVGEWGRTTGTCLVCGRRLDDPESVDRGIGPVCYGRMS